MTKTCRTCKNDLPITSFGVNNRQADGLMTQCRSCERARSLITRTARAARVVTPTKKRCRACEMVRPASEFPRKRDNADGLYSYCRSCVSEQQRAVRDRRVAGTMPYTEVETKRCSGCKEMLPCTKFYRATRSHDGLGGYCKTCQKASGRRRAYGVTVEQVRHMEEAQEHRCAICRQVLPLCVDHDHGSLEVRGMLCRPCNTGLGQFEDRIDYLQAAIDYLRQPRPFLPN